jgi:hypothetical protein
MLLGVLQGVESAVAPEGGVPVGAPAPSEAPTPPPASTPAASGPARKLTAAEKKGLWKCNFQSLKVLGFNDNQVDAMDASEKFEPINYATAAVGCKRLDEVYADQVELMKEHMRNWIKGKQADAGAPPVNDGERLDPDEEEAFD